MTEGINERVVIGDDVLQGAIAQVRERKEEAVAGGDAVAHAELIDIEKDLIHAMGGQGLTSSKE